MPVLYRRETLPASQESGPIQPIHLIKRIRDNLERVIMGKTAEIELLLAAVLSGGHVLLEDIPGVGKTTLAKALARAVGGTLRRIQCTPDLLPADIVGVSVFNPQEGAFHFKPGPIFTNILLADELNRASPRTQSALLEAMGERQVTVGGQSLQLESFFVVIATQNPIESYGTYPLPEAQLDRFAVQLSLGYPPPLAAKQLLRQPHDTARLEVIEPILSPDDIVALQRAAAGIEVEETIADYVLALVEASRLHPAVRLGISPRGALAFLATARARALIAGRGFVTPDDVKTLAIASLAHRLMLHTQVEVSSAQKETVVRELLAQVQVPR